MRPCRQPTSTVLDTRNGNNHLTVTLQLRNSKCVNGGPLPWTEVADPCYCTTQHSDSRGHIHWHFRQHSNGTRFHEKLFDKTHRDSSTSSTTQSQYLDYLAVHTPRKPRHSITVTDKSEPFISPSCNSALPPWLPWGTFKVVTPAHWSFPSSQAENPRCVFWIIPFLYI